MKHFLLQDTASSSADTNRETPSYLGIKPLSIHLVEDVNTDLTTKGRV
jgi:hypothetical protein